MFQNRNKAEESNQPKKYPHWTNSPFTMEYKGVKISADETGKITLIQEHDDETFDEIVTTAALFNRVVRILQMNRTLVFKDYPYGKEEE